jgi:hypothetical protein
MSQSNFTTKAILFRVFRASGRASARAPCPPARARSLILDATTNERECRGELKTFSAEDVLRAVDARRGELIAKRGMLRPKPLSGTVDRYHDVLVCCALNGAGTSAISRNTAVRREEIALLSQAGISGSTKSQAQASHSYERAVLASAFFALETLRVNRASPGFTELEPFFCMKSINA